MAQMTFPQQGMKREDLFKELQARHSDDANWRGARTFGLVYNPGEELMETVKQAYLEYMVENALSPTSFPSLRRFESELISMTANLLRGDDDVVGNMTSGGTESIFMAVKTARDWARSLRGKQHASGQPWQILIPASAHPAFDKAAHYLDLEVLHVPLGDDLRADVNAAAERINERTIMMVGSAPGYPHGVIDPIEDLAALAQKNNIWFHTDACLGGFLLPFIRDLGYTVPDFDFTVPGVSSISADVHKYGYAAKGASTVLYRDESLRKHQFYVQADWCGGIYATPSLAGARTGGSIAAAWAAVNYLGRSGYLQLAERIMKTTQKFLDGVAAIDGLEILGKPMMSVFAIGSQNLNLYAIADALHQRGWHVERQHMPPALHLMVSPAHAEVADDFLQALRESCDEVRKQAPEDISQMAAMYGMMGTMPDRKAAKGMALEIMSQLYRV